MRISDQLQSCLLFVIMFGLSTAVYAQGSAGSGGKFEPRFLVDMPTAGMQDKGTFAFDADFYQEGGLLLGFSVGVFDRLSFGISYGGSALIGPNTPVMNEVPGVKVKVRLIEENMFIPAIVLGFDTQGKDGYLKEQSRYVIKSPGLYAAASKNYAFLGFLSIHGGVNYSLERADGDRDINGFVGAEKTIGPFVSVIVEYNIASNDNTRSRGRGYLNAALKWSISGGLTLGVNFKDLMNNGRESTVANRTVSLEYIRFF
jgi:hypothetical protein